MSKKSLLYVGAGVLMILVAILTFVEGGLVWWGDRFGRYGLEGLSIDWRVFKDSYYMDMYKESLDFMFWVNIGLLVLAGVVLLAKAFVPDLIPDIALVGIFGLLALMALISVFSGIINMFRRGNEYYGIPDFDYCLGSLIGILPTVLTLIAFGGMAAIFMFKDGFGRFFFVPTLSAIASAGIMFLINIGTTRNLAIWAYTTVWSFGASFVFFMFDCVLIAALFATGLAINEE